jgi:hypothetical protein
MASQRRGDREIPAESAARALISQIDERGWKRF